MSISDPVLPDDIHLPGRTASDPVRPFFAVSHRRNGPQIPYPLPLFSCIIEGKHSICSESGKRCMARDPAGKAFRNALRRNIP